MSSVQVTRWLNTSQRSAGRRLQRLVAAGLLAERRVVVAQVTVGVPLATWCPHQPTQTHASTSTAARSRYRQARRERVTLYAPKQRALEHFGIRRAFTWPTAHKISHDWAVAELLLWYRQYLPALTAGWVGEDVYRGKRAWGEKVEDALILDFASRQPKLAVEWCGSSYTRERLDALAVDLERRGVAYAFH